LLKIIGAPFLKEAEDRKEDMESPNSRAIVEVGLDEISLTLGFNFQMFQVEDVESPNSCTVIEVGFDEIPSTLGVDFEVHFLFAKKMSPFHVIFDLNGILIATRFDRGSTIVILYPRLKEFLEKCLVQFQVYI
jgi:hypothetical protein